MSDGAGNDPYSNVGDKFGRVELPKYNFDAFNVSPTHSFNEPDYLDINIKGRSVYEKATFNSGMLYLCGISMGGAYGAIEGNRLAPSSRTLIKANSIMNAAGKRGSKLGNAFAVLALFYTTSEHLLDNSTVEKMVGSAYWIPQVLAAGTAGILYKSTAPLRTMGLAGFVGCAGMGLFCLGQSAFGTVMRRR